MTFIISYSFPHGKFFWTETSVTHATKEKKFNNKIISHTFTIQRLVCLCHTCILCGPIMEIPATKNSK